MAAIDTRIDKTNPSFICRIVDHIPFYSRKEHGQTILNRSEKSEVPFWHSQNKAVCPAAGAATKIFPIATLGSGPSSPMGRPRPRVPNLVAAGFEREFHSQSDIAKVTLTL
jgi:hypothetical protein